MSLLFSLGINGQLVKLYQDGDLTRFDHAVCIASDLKSSANLSHAQFSQLFLYCEAFAAIWGYPHPEIANVPVDVLSWPRCCRVLPDLDQRTLRTLALIESVPFFQSEWTSDFIGLRSRLKLVEKKHTEYDEIRLRPMTDLIFLEDSYSITAQRNDVNCRDSLIMGLKSEASYWAECAISWIEQGFPLDEDLVIMLQQISIRKSFSKQTRARALTIVNQWYKSMSEGDV